MIGNLGPSGCAACVMGVCLRVLVGQRRESKITCWDVWASRSKVGRARDGGSSSAMGGGGCWVFSLLCAMLVGRVAAVLFVHLFLLKIALLTG